MKTEFFAIVLLFLSAPEADLSDDLHCGEDLSLRLLNEAWVLANEIAIANEIEIVKVTEILRLSVET